MGGGGRGDYKMGGGGSKFYPFIKEGGDTNSFSHAEGGYTNSFEVA